ncbi:MAG: hypothetical protein LBP81_09915 [Treponema sp.]|jgi:hypothetical protein|nr:hypothetical protein [Treponema sp.]
MRDDLPLDSFLQSYRAGKLDKKELEGSIFDYVLKNSNRFRLHRWAKDERIDFLCWFYPRISRSIDNYRNKGASFDAYIAAMVRWASREYIRLESGLRITEQTYWDVCTQETAVCEREPPVYGGGGGGRTMPFKAVNNPRQTLMLLLKSYYFISEEFIDRAAPAIGMKKERLKCLIEQLRNMRVHRDTIIKKTRDRIYTLYFRRISLEWRVGAAFEGSLKQEKLKIRLERTIKQLAVLRNRFKRMRLKPTNRQVAQVLGLPKGTIDSSLFAVRAKPRYAEEAGEEFSSRNYFDEYYDDDAAALILK